MSFSELHCVGILCLPKKGYAYNEINSVAECIRCARFIGVRIFNENTRKINDIDIPTIRLIMSGTIKFDRKTGKLDRTEISIWDRVKNKINNMCDLSPQMVTKDEHEAFIVCGIENNVVHKKLIAERFTIIRRDNDFSVRICINAGEEIKIVSAGYTRVRKNICTNFAENNGLDDVYLPGDVLPILIDGGIRTDINFNDTAEKIINQYTKYKVIYSTDEVVNKFTEYISSLGISAFINNGVITLDALDDKTWIIIPEELTRKGIRYLHGANIDEIYINSISSEVFTTIINITTKYVILGSKIDYVGRVFNFGKGLEKIRIRGNNVTFADRIFDRCNNLRHIEITKDKNTYNNIVKCLKESGLDLRKITIEQK